MKLKMVAGALALAFGIAACGSDYSRDDAIKQLTEKGMAEDLAICIVDGAEDSFGIEKLSNDELTAEDEAKMQEIATDCVAS